MLKESAISIINYLQTFHSKYMSSTNKSVNRDQLQEAYIESIIDGMDHKSMYQFVYDSLDGNLDDYTTEELVTEVRDYYPELLEENEEMQEGSWY